MNTISFELWSIKLVIAFMCLSLNGSIVSMDKDELNKSESALYNELGLHEDDILPSLSSTPAFFQPNPFDVSHTLCASDTLPPNPYAMIGLQTAAALYQTSTSSSSSSSSALQQPIQDIDNSSKKRPLNDNKEDQIIPKKGRTNQSKSITCIMCGRTADDKQQFRKHIKDVHNGRFQCPKCIYNSLDKNHFETHFRTHSEKSYACDHPGCLKIFRQIYHLNRHKATHQSYACKYPGCTFIAELSLLNQHLLMHAKKMETPHKCNYPGCGVPYADPIGLAAHQRICVFRPVATSSSSSSSSAS